MNSKREKIMVDLISPESSGGGPGFCLGACPHCPSGVRGMSRPTISDFNAEQRSSFSVLQKYLARTNNRLLAVALASGALPVDGDLMPLDLQPAPRNVLFVQGKRRPEEKIDDYVQEVFGRLRKFLRDGEEVEGDTALQVSYSMDVAGVSPYLDTREVVDLIRLTVASLFHSDMHLFDKSKLDIRFDSNSLSPRVFDQINPHYISQLFELLLIEALAGGDKSKIQRTRLSIDSLSTSYDISTTVDHEAGFELGLGIRLIKGGKVSNELTPLLLGRKTILHLGFMPENVWVGHHTSFAQDTSVRVPYEDFNKVVDAAENEEGDLSEALFGYIEARR